MAQSSPQRRAAQPRGRSKLGYVIAALALLVVAWIAFSLRGATQSRTTGTTGADGTSQVALGKQVYAAQCANCHGPQLQGQAGWQTPLPDGSRLAPPHDPSGHTWHHPDGQLFQIIKQGGQSVSPPGYKNNMPAFPQLSDDEVRAVLAYIKSTWPPDIQAAQAEVTRQASSQ